MRKSVLGSLVVLVLILSSISAEAQEMTRYEVERPAGPSGGAIVVDVLVVRPVSFAALVVGAAISLVATPFALASGTTYPVYDKLLVEPYAFAICRPLGEFD